jgi:phage terminase large subunit GpA-like protein
MNAAGARWSSADCQWLRPIMEDFADDSVRRISCMCSAQSAKTLTFLCLLAYTISEDPGPILWLTKNETEAQKIAKSRILPIFEACAPVAAKMPKTRSRNKTLEIYFPGAPLIIASAENKAALQSTPFRYLFLDEARSYPPGALEMVRKRTRSFSHNFKEIIISTPAGEMDALHRSFLDGNAQVYHISCPHCGKEQPLGWKDDDIKGGLTWTEDESTKSTDGSIDFDKLTKTIRWECCACDGIITDNIRQRKQLGNSGRWVVTNPNAPSDTRSYTWNALLPYWAEWKTQVIERIKALQAMQWGDPEPLKSWITETCGQPYHSRILYAKDEKFIYKRQRDYDPKEPWPEEKRRIMTIDVQGKGGRHFWYVIRAWGTGAQSRLLDCGRVWSKEEWEQIARNWGVEPGNIAIDSGHWATEIYRMVVDSGYQYKAFKGEDKQHFQKDGRKAIFTSTLADPAIGTALAGRVKPLTLWFYSKPSCLERLTMMQHGELGDFQFHKDAHPEYALQSTAYEQREYMGKDGVVQIEWFCKREGKDHLASCEMMNICAAAICGLIYEPEKPNP